MYLSFKRNTPFDPIARRLPQKNEMPQGYVIA
jgi:hypothetical protein